jgi:hypothetical protein
MPEIRAACDMPPPLMRIDFYGERLQGCLAYNAWTDGVGTMRKIIKADVEALKGLQHERKGPPAY